MKSFHLNYTKCLSIDESKELSKRGKYVNFPAKVLKIATRDLSGTAFKLWEFLSAESVFNSDWSVQINIKNIAEYLCRSLRQSMRLISELLKKGYIEKSDRKKKILTFFVRLPITMIDEFKSIKTRKSKIIGDKNVIDAGGRSYYLYNTNNNDSKSTAIPEPTISADPVVNISPEIQKNESELVEISQKIHDLIIKNPGKTKEIYPQLEDLYLKESILKVRIDRLKPRPEKRPSVFSPSKTSEIIFNFGENMRIALRHKPNSEKIIREISDSVARGNLGHGNILRGINAGLKLVRENRWQTPIRVQ